MNFGARLRLPWLPKISRKHAHSANLHAKRISRAKCFPFTLFRTLSPQRECYALCFQANPNSFRKTPGVAYPVRQPTLLAAPRRPVYPGVRRAISLPPQTSLLPLSIPSNSNRFIHLRTLSVTTGWVGALAFVTSLPLRRTEPESRDASFSATASSDGTNALFPRHHQYQVPRCLLTQTATRVEAALWEISDGLR
jgi:hypothetical protein